MIKCNCARVTRRGKAELLHAVCYLKSPGSDANIFCPLSKEPWLRRQHLLRNCCLLDCWIAGRRRVQRVVDTDSHIHLPRAAAAAAAWPAPSCAPGAERAGAPAAAPAAAAAAPPAPGRLTAGARRPQPLRLPQPTAAIAGISKFTRSPLLLLHPFMLCRALGGPGYKLRKASAVWTGVVVPARVLKTLPAAGRPLAAAPTPHLTLHVQ